MFILEPRVHQPKSLITRLCLRHSVIFLPGVTRKCPVLTPQLWFTKSRHTLEPNPFDSVFALFIHVKPQPSSLKLKNYLKPVLFTPWPRQSGFPTLCRSIKKVVV